MSTPQKHDLTQATGITADLVLEQGNFYDAKDFRKVQTGLSSAARELRALTQYNNTLLGRLGAQLSHEQRELLSNAAALPGALGDLAGWRLRLKLDELQYHLGQRIRAGQLTTS